MLAFLLSWQSCAAVTELAWPTELSVFPVSPPMESNCQPSQCGLYEAGHASRHWGVQSRFLLPSYCAQAR